jgi:chemotaxis protein MotA
MDIFLIIFAIFGFSSIIGGFLLEGGHIVGLLSLPSFLIVMGGTIGAVGVSFPKEEFLQLPKIFKVIIKNQDYDFTDLMERMKAMCVKVRQSGLLSLENQIEEEPDALMRKGMRLIVDGTSPDYTREALELSLEVIESRHHSRSKILEAAGGYSPTMGIIGTVLGLVHVLSDLQEPETLGPKIAMAFIATLYGISFANLLWLPLATKLKEKNRIEILYKSMIIEGLLLIQEGVNTNYMDEKLSSFLSEAQLLSAKSSKGSIKSIRSQENLDQFAKKTADEYGGIDIWVNCHGIEGYSPLIECTEEFWNKVLDINLSGTWRGIKAAVPYMEKRGGGSIVNVSSFCSIVPTAKNGVYSISKVAVDSLTKVMAAELAPKNIRVNAVLPGFIATQMTADKVNTIKDMLIQPISMRRLGNPGDIARGILFLAGDGGRYIDGHALIISGGKFIVQNPQDPWNNYQGGY